MTCADLSQDLEAYALGALERDEAERVEAHIRACAECAAIVRAYRDAVDYLALSVPIYRAAPRLRERILAGAGWRPAANLLLTVRANWFATAAAVVLLAFALGGSVWAAMLSSEVSQLRRDNHRLQEIGDLSAEQRAALLRMQQELETARNRQVEMSSTLQEQATLLIVALDPDLIPTRLQGTPLAANATCNYVWSSSQKVGALTCKDLPQTALSLIYELWATKGDKTVPLGSFLARYDGTASVLVKFPPDTPGEVTSMWVTLEQQNAARSQPSASVVLQSVPALQAAR